MSTPWQSGPGTPRWRDNRRVVSPHLVPTDSDELLRWLEDGTLVEGPNLDFKRELGLTDSARRELAKHVAAMANNGGRLILGVDKPADGRPPACLRHPLPLPHGGSP